MILWRKLLLIFVVNIITNAEILIDNDGGYKNIVIGITPEHPVSTIDSLLLQLEELFRDTSTALLTASKDNVFFKELVFVIPKKYQEAITSRQLLRGAKDFKRPDIFITENDSFLNPYTVQHGGCGRQGLRIHVPREILNASAGEKAFSLVRQWAHYRYGVFDESGFPDDEVYPACYRIPGSDTIRVSDCTNKKAIYDMRESKIDDHELAPSACSPVPVSGQNDHINSSIMTNIYFPKMRHFCDGETHPHNRIAPTKQNALCGEKSIWEVISAHPDFKLIRKHASNVKSTFKYILESDPRLILAVDSSNNMDLNGRMDLVKNAFAYFTLYDLPNNSSVGIVNMGKKEINPVLTNIQTVDDAERLIDTFPEVYGEADICVDCTIQTMIAVLKLDINDIILATATDIAETKVDNVITMLKSSKVALHVIYFEQKLKQSALLEDVAKKSGGSFYHIAEAFPSGTSVSSLTLLYEAFRSVSESFSWINRNHVLVDQKIFSNNCSPKCILTFPTDLSIESFQVLITGPDFKSGPPVFRDSIVLENDEQHITPSNRSFTYKEKIAAYLFTIKNPQPKLWNLNFERKPGYNKPVVVMVRATNSEYGDILNMQSWVTFDERDNVETPKRPPFTMYSEIKKDYNPVIGARVVAFIHQVSNNKERSLQLIDSGEGDPDITKNDGIFSRYLTGIEEAGYHSITIVAEKQSSNIYRGITNAQNKELNCCGSFIPTNLAYNSGAFKRVTTIQSFFVKSQYANINYPPRKVMDLRVERMEIFNNGIKCYVLKWTAPGENYDEGKAISYDIKVFSSREDALNDFDSSFVLEIKMLNIQGPLLVPAEVGTIQTALVELTNLTSGTYFIAMKTMSHSRKSSDVSNLVEVSYIDPTAPPFIGSSKDSFSTFPDDGTTETISGNNTTNALSSNVGLAIGLSCGILLLLIIIGIIIFICCERKRKAKSNDDPVYSQNTKKTESNDALCNGDGNISIISPVTSWGADSLISHYETLQKNKNLETNSIMTVQQNKDTDSVSFSSSKYSYDNKIDQHTLYDPIYFHQVRSQDELNYQYNPACTFSPIYTSSLRRCNNEEILGIPDPSENANFYNYTTDRNNLSRLRTDV